MSKPTVQAVTVAWLKSVGYKEVKQLSKGTIVLTNDMCGFWYIGTGGSVRYGRTRHESYPTPNHFRRIVGVSLDEIQRSRRWPGPSVAGLEI